MFKYYSHSYLSKGQLWSPVPMQTLQKLPSLDIIHLPLLKISIYALILPFQNYFHPPNTSALMEWPRCMLILGGGGSHLCLSLECHFPHSTCLRPLQSRVGIIFSRGFFTCVEPRVIFLSPLFLFNFVTASWRYLVLISGRCPLQG